VSKEGLANSSTAPEVPLASSEALFLASATVKRRTEGTTVGGGEKKRKKGLATPGVPPVETERASMTSGTGEQQTKENPAGRKKDKSRKKSSVTSGAASVTPNDNSLASAASKRQVAENADGSKGEKRRRTVSGKVERTVPRRQAGGPLVDITAYNNNRAVAHKRIIRPSAKLRDV